jgi:hypothetical protein
MHLNAAIATQCLAQTSIDGNDFVFLPLRLSFGGSACPAEWCIASEITTDLANKILNHKHWNPTALAPKLSRMIPETKLLDSEIPFHPALPMIVNPDLERVGKSDVYVDDICLVGLLSDKESEHRLKNNILLALEIVGRPISPSEPLPRDELASKSKLLAEAGLSESKCMLGWDINTRTLRINLPTEKYTIWSLQINEILSKKGRSTKQILEVVIGRLNHAASIIPLARHFLSRMYASLSIMKEFKIYYLPKQVLNDLELWQKILSKAHNGISLNLITNRSPNKLYWSDACEYGIGGFSAHGKAWRWPIPLELQHRAHINLLEFMAELAGIWDDILENRVQPEDCLLAFGDSTTAMGWIHKTKYKMENENKGHADARLTIARKLADLIIDHDLKLYSQWFAGADNEVADFLSREGGLLDDDILTQTLLLKFPQQVPRNCRVSALRPEIISFFSETLQRLPKQQPQQHSTKNSIPHHGSSGKSTSSQLNLKETHLSKNSTNTNETNSSHYSLNFSDPDLFLREEFQNWLREQSEIPSAQWHRPSWRTTHKTQEYPLMEKQRSAYEGY